MIATKEIAPGSILQRIYLKQRLKQLPKGHFLELGAGTGYISRILLEAGFSGTGYDLNAKSCALNQEMNAAFVSAGKYAVLNQDFLEADESKKCDSIISCMVIEHLDDAAIENFFNKCKRLLRPGGRIISLVPSGMQFWGIEDNIAGHFRRYEFADFEKLARQHALQLNVCDGLTYPISNWLLPLSNYLIKRSESEKLKLSKQEQTVLSSNRKVMLKTDFPSIFQWFLNDITLRPLHWWQMANRKNPKSMVIYSELEIPQV